jgi:hypothetical protein
MATKERRVVESPDGQGFIETDPADWIEQMDKARASEGAWPLPRGHIQFKSDRPLLGEMNAEWAWHAETGQ